MWRQALVNQISVFNPTRAVWDGGSANPQLLAAFRDITGQFDNEKG
jgi:hypothetical protein